VRPFPTRNPRLSFKLFCPLRSRESESTSIPNAPAVLAVPAEKSMREIVIPLVHDAQFFDLFEDNVQTLTLQMEKMHSEFLESLSNLTGMITETCQPASATGSYHPYSSVLTHPGTVEVKVKHMKVLCYSSALYRRGSC
jgi:hypothetical protein